MPHSWISAFFFSEQFMDACSSFLAAFRSSFYLKTKQNTTIKKKKKLYILDLSRSFQDHLFSSFKSKSFPGWAGLCLSSPALPECVSACAFLLLGEMLCHCWSPVLHPCASLLLERPGFAGKAPARPAPSRPRALTQLWLRASSSQWPSPAV